MSVFGDESKSRDSGSPSEGRLGVGEYGVIKGETNAMFGGVLLRKYNRAQIMAPTAIRTPMVPPTTAPTGNLEGWGVDEADIDALMVVVEVTVEIEDIVLEMEEGKDVAAGSV